MRTLRLEGLMLLLLRRRMRMRQRLIAPRIVIIRRPTEVVIGNVLLLLLLRWQLRRRRVVRIYRILEWLLRSRLRLLGPSLVSGGRRRRRRHRRRSLHGCWCCCCFHGRCGRASSRPVCGKGQLENVMEIFIQGARYVPRIWWRQALFKLQKARQLLNLLHPSYYFKKIFLKRQKSTYLLVCVGTRRDKGAVSVERICTTSRRRLLGVVVSIVGLWFRNWNGRRCALNGLHRGPGRRGHGRSEGGSCCGGSTIASNAVGFRPHQRFWCRDGRG